MFKKSNLFAAITLAISTMTFSSFASADKSHITVAKVGKSVWVIKKCNERNTL